MKHKEKVMVDSTTYNVISVCNGGMGRVWLLEKTFDEPFHPIYRQRIAVKTFDFVQDYSNIEHELNIWISLDHPCILPLRSIGKLDYRLAAIMPLLQGNLDDLLKIKGSLSEGEVVDVTLKIVEALKYAWNTAGILHLDLKPSNVLINDHLPSIQIGDWGISRLIANGRPESKPEPSNFPATDPDHMTAFGAGTLPYMSPERFSGEWLLSPAADVYSLGIMAIQLNTGILPFRFGDIDPYEEIVTGSYFNNACKLLSTQSDHFRQFCLQCIHPNPTRRFFDHKHVIAQLNTILRKG